MKRQNVRKMILIISMLLFPITIWFMSPYLIIQGAMDGIITGSFIVFISLLILSVFFGRLFCSWLCPMGCLQECLYSVNYKNPKQGWKNSIKYVIWFIWIAIVILCFVFRKGEIKIDFLYMTDHGISISEIYNYVIYYGVIFLIFVPSVLFGKRTFCHYFCWIAPFMDIGIKLRRVLHLPGSHIEYDNKKCISCGMCSRSCPMGIDVKNNIEYGKKINKECIQCGCCVDNCPKKALSLRWDNGVRKNG